VIADRGYSFPSCRNLLRRRGICHTIPDRKDQRERRAERPGRRPGFDREVYRRRNVVERYVGRLKQWRSLATRYEKRAVNYRAMVVIASLMMWLPS
jgi:transposase